VVAKEKRFLDEEHAQAMKDTVAESAARGFRNLLEKVTPWLLAVGSWIFGGLLAFNLLAISALITVGPVDSAVLTSITAFACALPLNLAGIIVLKLIADMKDIGISELALNAFKEAEFPDIETYFPSATDRESHQRKRAEIVLRYSLGILAASVAFTVVGLVAALWHMAWWIGVIFIVMVVISAGFVFAVMAHSLPPKSEAEKEMRGRLREERNT